jgi:hypothetical protein
LARIIGEEAGRRRGAWAAGRDATVAEHRIV